MTDTGGVQLIASVCSESGCPTVYAYDDGSDDIVIQGYQLESWRQQIPTGETVARIPRSLLIEAAAQLGPAV